MATAVLRHIRFIAIWALIPAIAVVAYTLLAPRTYTAASSFIPQSRGMNLGGVTALAAQLGVLPIGSETTEGPAFYADLATSRQLLGRLVDDSFTLGDDAGAETTTLLDWYEVEGETAAARRAAAIDRLRQDVDASVTTRTGVVRLRLTLSDPELAAAVNGQLLELLNEFNLRSRQTKAGQEREFIEQRMMEVGADLRAAEDRLADFMRQNREYTSSPELFLQYERLSREISLQQQLFVSLAESFEQAKIEEVRNTPVISILETPEVPVRPDARYLVLKAILAILAGALFGFLLVMGRDYVQRARERDRAGYLEFQEERARIRDRLGMRAAESGSAGKGS